MTTWHEHAIWWHVYPLGFLGLEPAGPSPADAEQHHLLRLVDWLDYAVDLGVNGLALGPVFASTTHGYDTEDHYRIDPRLGMREDFDALVEAAHDRGLRIMLDGVFNHVGSRHPTFRRALGGGPSAPEADLFHLTWSDDGEASWRSFEGHQELVTLDHGHDAVADLVTDVMRHWLAAGADAWRLDAAYAVPPAFWARVLPAVRAGFPEVLVAGEVIHGDYAQIVADTGMDTVTQYELWKAIWSAINDRNLFELEHALGRHDAMLASFAPLTFVGNHDVTRLASRLHYRRHLPHALAVLFTVGGMPSVYYGDEQGFEGIKEDRAGGDDAVRPAFPASAAGLGLTGWPTYAVHQELIGLRRRHPWLYRARTRVLEIGDALLVYESAAAGERVVVVLNLTETPVQASEPVSTVLAGTADVVGGRARVPGNSWAVLG